MLVSCRVTVTCIKCLAIERVINWPKPLLNHCALAQVDGKKFSRSENGLVV